jgi:hypothetical protein
MATLYEGVPTFISSFSSSVSGIVFAVVRVLVFAYFIIFLLCFYLCMDASNDHHKKQMHAKDVELRSLRDRRKQQMAQLLDKDKTIGKMKEKREKAQDVFGQMMENVKVEMKKQLDRNVLLEENQQELLDDVAEEKKALAHSLLEFAKEKQSKTTVQQKLQDTKNDIWSLKQTNVGLEQKVSRLEEDLKQATDNIVFLNDCKKKSDGEPAQLQQEVTQLKHDLKAANNDILSLNESKHKVLGRLERKEHHLKDAKKDTMIAIKRMHESKEAHAREWSQIHIRIVERLKVLKEFKEVAPVLADAAGAADDYDYDDNARLAEDDESGGDIAHGDGGDAAGAADDYKYDAQPLAAGAGDDDEDDDALPLAAGAADDDDDDTPPLAAGWVHHEDEEEEDNAHLADIYGDDGGGDIANGDVGNDAAAAGDDDVAPVEQRTIMERIRALPTLEDESKAGLVNAPNPLFRECPNCHATVRTFVYSDGPPKNKVKLFKAIPFKWLLEPNADGTVKIQGQCICEDPRPKQVKKECRRHCYVQLQCSWFIPR